MDEGGRRQCAAAGRSDLDAGHRKQQPGNGILGDEVGVGGGDRGAAPNDARVLRILPRGANLAVLGRVGIGVWAEEVGDNLPIAIVEQRGLRREEHKLEAAG